MHSALSRRSFLQVSGVAAVGAMVSSAALASGLTITSPQQLLKITSRTLDINGKPAKVYGLIGPDGRQGLSFIKGDRFNVRLQNQCGEPTLIHWHGLTPPWAQDGVPGVTQELLQDGKSYDYDFILNRSGTNWMHAHTLQEQRLMAAPLIVRDTAQANEQELVILLHDFSFKTPEELLTGLQGGSSGHQMDGMPMNHAMMGHDMSQMGDMSSMHNNMMQGMDTTDVNDIEYDAYLANDHTLDDPEITRVDSGSTIRLRIINGATSTGFTVDLGELSGQAIAADGMDIVPVSGQLFPITMGQRLDIRIALPNEQKAWPILFRREGRVEQTGVILAARGASISRIAPTATAKGPVLDWSFEKKLRAAKPLDVRPADVSAEYDLTGSMSPYVWAMKQLNSATPNLAVASGQRVEVTLNNRSMMAHPMHLHGHHFQVLALNGQKLPGAVRDTLLIPPMANATIAFDADNPGAKWAFHCHHLYHMATGMMSFVEYTDAAHIEHHPGSVGD